MRPDVSLPLGVAALLVAVCLLLFTAFGPRYKGVALARRRPQTEPAGPSAISKLGDAAVSAVERRMGREATGPFGREALEGAGVKSSPSEFVVLVLIATVLLGVVGFILQGLLTAILLAILGPVGALVLIKFRTGRRHLAFENQLSDMLMSLSGSLRAGHGVSASLHNASLEMPSPMAEELARIVNETRVGRPATDSMAEVARRMDSEDFEWLSQAIEINREVGGDLAGVLDHVAHTVRERAQIKAQVRALAAEGKFSAYILIALPFIVAVALNLANPGYMDALFQNLLGWVFIVVGVVMMAIGSFWISRMVKIKF